MTTEKDLQDNEEVVEEKVTVETNEEVDNENNEPAVEVIFDENEASSTDEESPSELSELKSKVAQLEKELNEKENRVLRVQADFDNYRRRTRQDIDNIEKYRSQSLALEIINAVDNFERALQTEVQSDEAKSVLKGMEMIYQSIMDALKKEGVEPIESVGQEFNPEYHHAVMQDQDEEKASNVILEEFQKGYKLYERVIRPAMVKVNQ